jgi:cobalt/nickel transport system permease protein
MISEPFALGNSPLHRCDPRIRLVAATAYSFVVALSHEFPTLSAALILSMALVSLARLQVREVLKRLAVVNGLVVLLWLVIPFTFPGEALFRIGPLHASRQAIVLAAQITLKSNAIMLAFIALVATMPLATLGYALNRLRVPDKIVHLLLMTYRYLFVLEQEYQRLMRAVKIRGFQPSTNLHTYRTYAYVVGMLFVRAAERAERVQQAMLCRGFKRKFYCLQDFKAGRSGLIFSLLMSAALLALVAMELRGAV